MDDVYNTRQGFAIPSEHIPSDDDMLRYSQGDESVQNKLIEGLMGYIVTTIEWFISNTPTAKPYYEDCLSEALLELTDYVNKNLGRRYTPGHFVSTVRLATLSAVKGWLREMSISIRVPKSTQRRNNETFTQQKLKDNMLSSAKDQVFDQVWFDTFVDGLDTFDRQIVTLKMSDQTDREISRELGIHHTHVKRHLQRLALIFTGN